MLWPEAGEAMICRVGGGPPPDPHAPPAADPAEEAAREEARVRRSRGKLSRYIRANRLGFLWTLTFAEATPDLAAANAAWDAFARRLRERLGRLPVAAVFEPHPGGHGYHVHFVTDRFLSFELVRRLWGRGIVDVGDRGRYTYQAKPRELAKYLAKYLGKQLDAGELHGCTPRARGQHRYRVSQGFSPLAVRRYFASAGAAYGWLRREYGEPDDGAIVSYGADGLADRWRIGFPERLQYPPPLTGAAARRWPAG